MKNVSITSAALEQASRLPPPIQARIRRLIVRLANWPDLSGAKALKGNLKGRYRVRTGDYRIQFRVLGAEIIVEKVGHRDRFYDE